MHQTPDRIATSDDPPCAVVDCINAGRPQICPYDDRYHRHGHIHYGDGMPSALTFRDDGWHYVCDAHYTTLTGELDAHRIRVGVPL